MNTYPPSSQAGVGSFRYSPGPGQPVVRVPAAMSLCPACGSRMRTGYTGIPGTDEVVPYEQCGCGHYMEL